MELKPLRRRDIARCVEIERELFPGDSPWTARDFESELDSGAHYLGVCNENGDLIGYGGVAVNGPAGDPEAEVHTMAIAADAQGRGLGAALLDALLAHADAAGAPVFLEVRTDNERAKNLYASRGFVQLGVRKRYYHPSGADAYTMHRPAVLRGEADQCAS